MSKSDTRGGPTADDFRPKLFRDRVNPDDWRVERLLDDGESIEVHVFTGADAKRKARRYAVEHYDDDDEIELQPYAYARRSETARRK